MLQITAKSGEDVIDVIYKAIGKVSKTSKPCKLRIGDFVTVVKPEDVASDPEFAHGLLYDYDEFLDNL